MSSTANVISLQTTLNSYTTKEKDTSLNDGVGHILESLLLPIDTAVRSLLLERTVLEKNSAKKLKDLSNFLHILPFAEADSAQISSNLECFGECPYLPMTLQI